MFKTGPLCLFHRSLMAIQGYKVEVYNMYINSNLPQLKIMNISYHHIIK